MQSAIEVKSE